MCKIPEEWKSLTPGLQFKLLEMLLTFQLLHEENSIP